MGGSILITIFALSGSIADYNLHKTRISPDRACSVGRLTARKTDGIAGVGCRSKRMSCYNSVNMGFNVTQRESGQNSDWSFIAKEFVELELNKVIANDIKEIFNWCNFSWQQGMEIHKLDNLGKAGIPTTDAYRKGNEREEVQQGKSLAKASYSLLFSKMYGGTKSYQQQGGKNSWN